MGIRTHTSGAMPLPYLAASPCSGQTRAVPCGRWMNSILFILPRKCTIASSLCSHVTYPVHLVGTGMASVMKTMACLWGRDYAICAPKAALPGPRC